MKTRTRQSTLQAILIVAGLVLVSAANADTIFMKIEGIEGEVTQVGREGQIEVLAFNHEVAAPYDSATGAPTGKRTHSPFKIVMRLSKATPLIAQALARNEVLPKIEVFFWRPKTTGAEENYYKITLENCRVVSRRAWNPNKLDSFTITYVPSEEVAFVYQKITWTYTDGGVEYQDTWDSPAL